MKYKVVLIALAVFLVGVGLVATVYDEHNGEGVRYVQHESAQQLADLPGEDREAASSIATDAATFASHLPVISIDTRGQEVPGEVYYDESGHRTTQENGRVTTTLAEDGNDYITGDLNSFDAKGHANRLSDTPTLATACQLHYRGNTSREFDKKSYALKFVKDDGSDNNQEFLGMEKSENWILYGPELDKTMLRNYLSYNIAGQFMAEFVPDVRFCELFVNGEYQGVYLAVETIKVQSGRLDLNKAAEKDTAVSYVVAVDQTLPTFNSLDEFLHYTLRLNRYMSVEYPSELNLTEAQRRYIEQDLSSIEKSLFSYDYDSAQYGYAATMDVTSFVDLYLLNEFAINDDFCAYSTFLYKDIRGKLTLGPPWDYNNCYDNYKNETSAEGFYQVERGWYYMLFKDETFCGRVLSRYWQLRESELSEENLNAFIDDSVAYLGPAIERNYVKWGYLFNAEELDSRQKLEPDERNPKSYEAAIDQLKGFIEQRGAWLDANIENLRQYSHESAVKKFNH